MNTRAIFFFIWHFLRPSSRAKARSAITLLAALVIALVVALTLVYTSVTRGIQQRWEKQISSFWAPIRLLPTEEYKHSYFYKIPLYTSQREYSLQTLGQELQYQGHPPLQRTHSDALIAQLNQKKNNKITNNWKDSFDPEIDPPLPSHLTYAKDQATTHPLLELNARIDRYRKDDNSPLLKRTRSTKSTIQPAIEWIETFQSLGRWQHSIPIVHNDNELPPLDPRNKDLVEALESPAKNRTEPPLFAHHAFILSYASIPDVLLKTIEALDANECSRLHRILSLQERIHSIPEYHPPHLSHRLLSRLQELPQHGKNVRQYQEQAQPILQALNMQPSCVWLPSEYRNEDIYVGDTIELTSASEKGYINSYETRSLLVAGFFSSEMEGWATRSIIVSAPTGKTLYLHHPKQDAMVSNHIGVWLPEFQRHQFKKILTKHFTSPGRDNAPLTKWFAIESLEDYPFCKDFILQLAGDRIILMSISILILIVASSSIVSMLIILVHERRDAIAIFRILGVRKKSIMQLFALLGFFMGSISSMFGLLIGVLFLKALPFLASCISSHLGYILFNPLFFGKSLPTTIDPSAAAWICLATTILSLIAGSIAARYATSYSPQKLLQNQ